MNYKSVIVVGVDHYNTLWLVRSLGMANFEPIVIIIGSRNRRSFVSKSKYCKQVIFIDSLDNLVDKMLDLQLSQRTVVFSSGDPVAKLLDTNYNVLSEKYILHHCSEKQGGIVFWMDKSNMITKAKECGLIVPITFSIDLRGDYDLSDIVYPCLLKPELSANSSKDFFRICNDRKDLQLTILSIKEKCPRIIIQELIKPDFEYLLYGVSTSDEIFIPGGLHKLHTCSDTKNLGMMSISYLSKDIPSQLDSLDSVKKFIKGIGYHGVFSVEFMITKNKAYFLEVNLRNDGTCYVTTQAGVNIPAIWTAAAYGIDVKKYSRSFKWNCTYGMNEINYLKYTFKKVGIIQAVKDFYKTKAFSLWCFYDIKPFLYKFIYR